MAKRTFGELDGKSPQEYIEQPKDVGGLLHNDAAKSNETSTIICELFPCRNQHLIFEDYGSFEAHYLNMHNSICEACECIFPNNDILDLHIEENHDPFLEIQKEKKYKVFKCYEYNSISKCKERFYNNQSRKAHMIEFHGYPKDFCFNIYESGWNLSCIPE